MKIALPSRGDQIDAHFGHCECFTVFTTEESKVVNKEIVPSPDGCGCKSNIASVLANMGVTIMLAGNMGDGAVNVLRNAGIKAIRGCAGSVQDAVLAYLSGSVADSGVSCKQHEHGCQHSRQL